MMKPYLYVVPCLIITFFISCTSIPIRNYSEPASIVIRNSSTNNIKEVSIRESSFTRASARMGVVSPLPKGISQTVGRPTSPPPLPGNVIVCWVTMADSEVCNDVNLREVLRMTPAKGRALVFEIRSDSELRVYIE